MYACFLIDLSVAESISDFKKLFATHYTGVLISDDLKETSINRDLTPNMGMFYVYIVRKVHKKTK